MNNGERKKRDIPNRSQPDRGFANMFGQPVGIDPNTHNARPKPDGDWSDNVDRGVKLGYKVIEDQILQGQRFAEKMGGGFYGASPVNGDIQDLAKDFQQYAEDSIYLYSKVIESLSTEMRGMGSQDSMDSNTLNQGVSTLMDSFTRAFASINTTSSSTGSGEYQSTSGSTRGKDVNVVCSVSSKRLVEVDINVQIADCLLCIDRLYEHDIDKPPLTGISLETKTSTQVRLKVIVSDEQPSGHYSGVIYNPKNKSHCGTLSVTIYD